MCGFAGVVAWDDKYRVTREALARMSAAIAHRGPDGEGVYLNHEDEVRPDRPQVGLVHRRLAILDPDPRSNQPFTDGRHWLVFNGEIYNYRELRAELKGLLPNYEWRTNGDTEVLLASYAAWGERCVEHLNGMFALAIWDSVEQSLFLARDRMGQKPLYFREAGSVQGSPCHVLAFASEISAFAPFEWVNRSLHPASLIEYLRWGYVTGEAKFDDTGSIAPSWWFFAKGHHGQAGKYFTTTVRPAIVPTRTTREHVESAVQRQLVSDVPIGCFLSGGMDSSVIALCASRALGSGQKLRTFSIGFDDPRYDESNYGAAVAKHLGTEHEQFIVQPDVVHDLSRLAAVFGEPFADSSALPTHYLSRETRRYVKVALSGDGGDELFGGYERYRAMGYERFISRIPKPVRQFSGQRLAVCLRGANPKSRTAKLKRFLMSIALEPGERYSTYMRLFQEGSIDELMPASGADVEYRARDPLAFEYLSETLLNDADPVQAVLRLDRENYLPYDLLTKVDRCSMLHALEVRCPFMDHELVQFAAGLTSSQLLKGGPKRMLREAFAAELPDFVFKRKKMGFAVPIGEWFRTDANLKAMLVDHLFATDSFARGHFVMSVVQRLVDEHMAERVDHSQRLYALLMLELWWKTAGK